MAQNLPRFEIYSFWVVNCEEKRVILVGGTWVGIMFQTHMPFNKYECICCSCSASFE